MLEIWRTSLDWVLNGLVVAVAATGGYRGMRRGFAREGLAIAGLAAGLWLAGRWGRPVQLAIEPFVGGGELAATLAYLSVVLATMMLATLLTVALDRFRKMPLLGGFDRVGGAILGMAQGSVLAGLILVMALRFSVTGLDEMVGEAALPRAVLLPLPRVLSYLPPELASVRTFFVEPLEGR